MSRYSFYSIIVPSYNRKSEILELIESFKALDFPVEKFELLIVDDGSDDGTPEMVEELAKEISFPLKVIRQKNQGPGAARNTGMAHARGEVFIFLDSDCTVSPQWLKAIDRDLNMYQADAFGGPDAGRDDFPPLLKAINYSMTSFLTTGGIRGHKKKKLGKFYPRSFNMGLSAELARKIGGFGNLRHGQDIEYSHRIIKSNARVILIPDAIVYHKRRTSIRKFFRQVFNWGVARINLYKIDSDMLEAVHVLPALATSFLLILLFGSLFSHLFWQILKGVLIPGVIVLILSGIHAAFRYREWRLLYLVPIVMPLQILGYGLGFLVAFIVRVLFKKNEFVGFRKKYYK